MTAVEWLYDQIKNGFNYNRLERNGYENQRDRLFEQAKELEKEQMTIKKCYHPLTQRKYISDIHFECTICGFYDMV